MTEEIKQRFKRKLTNQTFFEIKMTPSMVSNLKYFIQQELYYYNAVVEQFTARAKAFPQDILNIQDRDVKLLETFAQYGIKPNTLLSKSLEEWPDSFKSYYNVIMNNGKCILDSKQIGIMEIGAEAGHLPSSVRRSIVSETFSYVSNQAKILLAGKNTETLKAPLQMLQTQTLETKRHLQLARTAIDIKFDEEKIQSLITTPYGKEPLIVNDYDLREGQFNSIIIRSPYKTNPKQTWHLELKDSAKYLLNLTDIHPRQRTRR